LIRFWLRHPEQMVGQLAYFACSGILTDAYYKNNPVIVGPANGPITGWAMMVRSDLGVYYTKELVGKDKFYLDDFPFKTKCLAEGKIVIKHNRCFFKSFQSKDKPEKDSAWFSSQEHRRATNRYQSKRVREMFPEVFVRKGKKVKVTSGSGFGFTSSN
jgi:hypothetical protein